MLTNVLTVLQAWSNFLRKLHLQRIENAIYSPNYIKNVGVIRLAAADLYTTVNRGTTEPTGCGQCG